MANRDMADYDDVASSKGLPELEARWHAPESQTTANNYQILGVIVLHVV